MGKKINARVGTPINFDGMQVNIVIQDGKKKTSSDDLTGTTRSVNNSDGNNGGGSGNGSNGGQTTIQNITQNITQNQPSSQWQITELAAAVNSVAESMRSGLQELVSMTRGEISALSAFKEWKNTYDNTVNKEGYHRANYSGKQGLTNAIDALKHRDDFDQYVIKKMTDMANSDRGGLMTKDGQWTEKATDILAQAMDARQSSSLAGFVQMSVSALSSLDQRERMFKGKVDPNAQAGKLSLDKKEKKQIGDRQKAQQKQEDLSDKTEQQLDRIQKRSQETARKAAASEVDMAKEGAAAQADASKKITRSRKQATDAAKKTQKAEVKAEAKKASQQVKEEHRRAVQAEDTTKDSGPYAGMRWKDFVKKNGDFDTDAIEHYLKSKPNAEEPTMKDVFSATSYLRKQREAEREAGKAGVSNKAPGQSSSVDEDKLLRASAKADKQKAASRKQETAAASDEEKSEVKAAADKAKQAKRQAYKDDQSKKKEAGAAKKAAKAKEKAQEEQSKKETEAQKLAAKNAGENAQENSKYDGLNYNDFVTTRLDGTKAFNDNELKQRLKEKTGKDPSPKEVIEAKNYLRQQHNGVPKQSAQQPAERVPDTTEQQAPKPETTQQEQPEPRTKARSKTATSAKTKSKSTKKAEAAKSKETRVQKKDEKQAVAKEEDAQAALDAAERAVVDAEKERRDARIAYKNNPTAENDTKYLQARLGYQEALQKRKEAADLLATGKTKEQLKAERIAASGIDTSRKAKYDDFVSRTVDGKSTFLDDRFKLWLEAKNGRTPTQQEFRDAKAALEKQHKKDEAKAKQKAASSAARGSKEPAEKTGGDAGEQAKRGGGKKKAAVSEEEKLMANMEAAVQKYYKSGPKGQQRALNRLDHNAKRLEELQKSAEDQASKETKSGSKAKKTGEKTGTEPSENKAPVKGKKVSKSAEPTTPEHTEKKRATKADKSDNNGHDEQWRQKEINRITQKFPRMGERGKQYALGELKNLGVNTEEFLKNIASGKKTETEKPTTENKASESKKKKTTKASEDTGAAPNASKPTVKNRKATKSTEDVGTEPSESKAPAKGKKRTEVAGNTDTEPPEKKPVAKERKSVKGTESPISGETRDSAEKPKKKARATDTDKNKQDELRAKYESKKYDLEQYGKKAGGPEGGKWTEEEIKLFKTAGKNLDKASELITKGKASDAGSALRIATSQMGQLKKRLTETVKTNKAAEDALDKQRKEREDALAADRKASENDEKERLQERQRSADQLDKEIGDTVKQYSKLTDNPMFAKLPKAMQAGVANAIGNLDATGQADSLAAAQKAIADASKAIQDQQKTAALTESGQAKAEKSAYYMATRESSRNQLTDMAAIFKATGSAEDLQNYQKALTKVQWEEKAAQLKDYNQQLAMMANPTGMPGVDLSKNWAAAQIAMRDEILKMQSDFREASKVNNQARADNILKQMGSKTDLLEQSLAQTKQLQDAAKALESTGNYSRVAQGLKDNLAAAMNEMMNTSSPDKFIEKMNAVRTAISAISGEMKQIKLDDYWGQQTTALQNYNNTLQGLASRNGGQNKWTDSQRNAYAQAQQAFDEAEQARQARDMATYQDASQRGNERMNALNQSLTEVGKLSAGSKPQVDALSRSLMNFAAPMMLFRKFTGYMKKAAQNVSAIDSQMADLKKVTNNTDAEYQIFLQRAGQHAVQIGSSITDLVATTSTFAHMGYNLNDSQALGVTATKFANVGGFQNTTDAADTIIAAIKGFKNLNIGDADEVGDKLTAVANNYAVTATDISAGLRNSASALNVAGNDIDQSTAMITAIAEVTRDAGGAGSALKVLSMRIRGAKAELTDAGESTEGMAESTAKLRAEVYGLTNIKGEGGVDIMADEKTFKSTYDILHEISGVWGQMSDINRSALLEKLAGKVRSNQVAALLENFDQAEKVLETSRNAKGTMSQVHARWMDSVEARQAQFKAAQETASMAAMPANTLKGLYQAGTTGLGLLTNMMNIFGSGGVGIGAIGTAAALKSGAGNIWAGLGQALNFHIGGRGQKSLIDAYNLAYGDSLSPTAGRKLDSLRAAENKTGITANKYTQNLVNNTDSTIDAAKATSSLATSLKGLAKNALGAVTTFALIEGASFVAQKAWEYLDHEVINKGQYLAEAANTAYAQFEAAQKTANDSAEETKTLQVKIDELRGKENKTPEETQQLASMESQLRTAQLTQKILDLQAKQSAKTAMESWSKSFSENETGLFANNDLYADLGAKIFLAAAQEADARWAAMPLGTEKALANEDRQFLRDAASGSAFYDSFEEYLKTDGRAAAEKAAEYGYDVSQVTPEQWFDIQSKAYRDEYESAHGEADYASIIGQAKAYNELGQMLTSNKLAPEALVAGYAVIKAQKDAVTTAVEGSQEAIGVLGVNAVNDLLATETSVSNVLANRQEAYRDAAEMAITSFIGRGFSASDEELDNMQKAFQGYMTLSSAVDENISTFDALTDFLSGTTMGDALAKIVELGATGELTAESLEGLKLDDVQNAGQLFSGLLGKLGIDVGGFIATVNTKAQKAKSGDDGNGAAKVPAEKFSQARVDAITSAQGLGAKLWKSTGFTGSLDPSSKEYQELMSMDGHAYQAAIKHANGTLFFDKDAFDQIVQQKYKEELADLKADAAEAEKKFAAAAKTYAEQLGKKTAGTKDFDETAYTNAITDLQTYGDNLSSYRSMMAQIDYGMSGLSNWLNNKNGAESGDIYDELGNAAKAIRSGKESGLVGTREFRAALQFYGGENLKYEDLTSKDWGVLAGLAGVGKDGSSSKTVRKDTLYALKREFRDAGVLDKNGTWTPGMTTDEAAKLYNKKYGANIDGGAVQAIFMALNDYNTDSSMDYTFTNDTPVSNQKVLDAQDAFKAAVKAYNENTGSLEDVQKAAQAYLDAVTEDQINSENTLAAANAALSTASQQGGGEGGGEDPLTGVLANLVTALTNLNKTLGGEEPPPEKPPENPPEETGEGSTENPPEAPATAGAPQAPVPQAPAVQAPQPQVTAEITPEIEQEKTVVIDTAEADKAIEEAKDLAANGNLSQETRDALNKAADDLANATGEMAQDQIDEMTAGVEDLTAQAQQESDTNQKAKEDLVSEIDDLLGNGELPPAAAAWLEQTKEDLDQGAITTAEAGDRLAETYKDEQNRRANEQKEQAEALAKQINGLMEGYDDESLSAVSDMLNTMIQNGDFGGDENTDETLAGVEAEIERATHDKELNRAAGQLDTLWSDIEKYATEEHGGNLTEEQQKMLDELRTLTQSAGIDDPETLKTNFQAAEDLFAQLIQSVDETAKSREAAMSDLDAKKSGEVFKNASAAEQQAITELYGAALAAYQSGDWEAFGAAVQAMNTKLADVSNNQLQAAQDREKSAEEANELLNDDDLVKASLDAMAAGDSTLVDLYNDLDQAANDGASTASKIAAKRSNLKKAYQKYLQDQGKERQELMGELDAVAEDVDAWGAGENPELGREDLTDEESDTINAILDLVNNTEGKNNEELRRNLASARQQLKDLKEGQAHRVDREQADAEANAMIDDLGDQINQSGAESPLGQTYSRLLAAMQNEEVTGGDIRALTAQLSAQAEAETALQDLNNLLETGNLSDETRQKLDETRNNLIKAMGGTDASVISQLAAETADAVETAMPESDVNEANDLLEQIRKFPENYQRNPELFGRLMGELQAIANGEGGTDTGSTFEATRVALARAEQQRDAEEQEYQEAVEQSKRYEELREKQRQAAIQKQMEKDRETLRSSNIQQAQLLADVGENPEDLRDAAQATAELQAAIQSRDQERIAAASQRFKDAISAAFSGMAERQQQEAERAAQLDQERLDKFNGIDSEENAAIRGAASLTDQYDIGIWSDLAKAAYASGDWETFEDALQELQASLEQASKNTKLRNEQNETKTEASRVIEEQNDQADANKDARDALEKERERTARQEATAKAQEALDQALGDVNSPEVLEEYNALQSALKNENLTAQDITDLTSSLQKTQQDYRTAERKTRTDQLEAERAAAEAEEQELIDQQGAKPKPQGKEQEQVDQTWLTWTGGGTAGDFISQLAKTLPIPEVTVTEEPEEETQVVPDTVVAVPITEDTQVSAAEKPELTIAQKALAAQKDEQDRIAAETEKMYTREIGERHQISGKQMQEAGWTDVPEDDYATLYSSTVTGEGKTVLVTPITPEGEILSPDELDEYIGELLQYDPSEMFEHDTMGLLLAAMNGENDYTIARMDAHGQEMHLQQEQQYGTGTGIPTLTPTPTAAQNQALDDLYDQAELLTTAITAYLEQSGLDGNEQLWNKNQELQNAYARGDDANIGRLVKEAQELYRLVDQNADAAQEQAEASQEVTEKGFLALASAGASDVSSGLPKPGQQTTDNQQSNVGVVAEADTSAAQKAINNIHGTEVPVDVTADTSAAQAAVDNIDGGTVNVDVQYNAGPMPSPNSSIKDGGSSISMDDVMHLATGTGNAEKAMYLVDERGQELIEHVSQGTYELGTNDGPRFTRLNAGDIVHTAKETRKILRRGGAMANGGKVKMGQAATTGAGSNNQFGNNNGIPPGAQSAINYAKQQQQLNSGTQPASLSQYLATGTQILKFLQNTFDWIPTFLSVLKKKTTEFINAADDAIHYIGKNKMIDSAIGNVAAEIQANMMAALRYREFLVGMAYKGALPLEIIHQIQNGTLDIQKYQQTTDSANGGGSDEGLFKAINSYQEYWNKLVACQDALKGLNDQMEALAKQKMDNIVRYFEQIDDLLSKQQKSYESLLDLKKQYGQEVNADDYTASLKTLEGMLDNTQNEETAVVAELSDQLGIGEEIVRALLDGGKELWELIGAHVQKATDLGIQELTDNIDVQNDSIQQGIDSGEIPNYWGSIYGKDPRYGIHGKSIFDAMDDSGKNNLETLLDEMDEAAKNIDTILTNPDTDYFSADARINNFRLPEISYNSDGTIGKLNKTGEIVTPDQIFPLTMPVEPEVEPPSEEDIRRVGEMLGLNMVGDSEEVLANYEMVKSLFTTTWENPLAIGSETWYSYMATLEELRGNIYATKVEISEMNDEIAKIPLTNLQTGFDYLEDIMKNLEGVNDLLDAQGSTKSSGTYQTMISVGMKQIENLEEQNKLIEEQMSLLDPLSEKYQELRDDLNNNLDSIADIRENQERWNDAIIDLQIDRLRKQNDKYKEQLNLMRALDDLENARQRRILTYHDETGFVYEADEDALEAAQESAYDAVYSSMISQLEDQKELSNIYGPLGERLIQGSSIVDSLGNILVPVEDKLSGLDFGAYYQSILDGAEQTGLLTSLLNSIDMTKLLESAIRENNISIDLSGMTLNEVNDVKDLCDAIMQQLPNYLLQALYQKGA